MIEFKAFKKSNSFNRNEVSFKLIAALLISAFVVLYLYLQLPSLLPLLNHLSYSQGEQTSSIPSTITQTTTMQKTNETTTSKPIAINTTTSSSEVKYLSVVDFDGFKLMLNSSSLLVEYRGQWLPFIWLNVGQRTIDLTYFYSSSEEYIAPYYLLVNSTYTIAAYSANEIVQKVSKYYSPLAPIKIDLYPPQKECTLYVSQNFTLSLGNCKDITLTLVEHKGRDIFEAILQDINSSSLNFLRSHLISNYSGKSMSQIAWEILEWEDKNASYNYTEYSLPYPEVSDPISFYYSRSGVCADYALFTASALLAYGAEKAFIVTFDTLQGPHAAAGVKINGTFFILDQHLPVYEWADYVKYAAKPSGEKLQLLELFLDSNGKASIEAWTLEISSFSSLYPDTYPKDSMPTSLAIASVCDLASRLNISCSQRCDASIYYKFNLSDIPQLKAFNPVFALQFKNYFEELLLKSIGQSIANAKCIYAEEKGGLFYVYIG